MKRVRKTFNIHILNNATINSVTKQRKPSNFFEI